MSVKKTVDRAIGFLVNTVTSTVSQTSDKKERKKFAPAEGMEELCRQAAAEGIVLLKNDNECLPLKKGSVVSVFGRCQFDTFLVGYGSGGDVNAYKQVAFIKGLQANSDITVNSDLVKVYKKWLKKNKADHGYWGHWPMSHPEMKVSDALCKKAAEVSDAAIIILGRAAGEDRDNTLTKGSYYLTDEEEQVLSAVTRFFSRVCVVMNIGGIMDFSWLNRYPVSSLLIAWQGGMEAGNALADVLSGKISPSGCLPDTIAASYASLSTHRNFGNLKATRYEEDIFLGYRYFETFAPKAVLFPFGYGLSYSEFQLSNIAFQKTARELQISVSVKNTGQYPAKRAIQLYYGVKGSPLPVPEIQLIAFNKTDTLENGQIQRVSFTVPYSSLASFDDSGVSGYQDAWVLPKGKYTLYVGFHCRELIKAGEFSCDKTQCVKQLADCLSPKASRRLMRMEYIVSNGKKIATYAPAPVGETDLRQTIIDRLPTELVPPQDFEPDLNKVALGEQSIQDFIACLSDEELEALTRGDYTMNSPLGAKGNAGVFGGVTAGLREKGVPPIVCTDGPSGIRLASSSALLPNGTCLASTFHTALVQKLYEKLGEEMLIRGSDVLLAPGMNLHRDPLCGRNFEYFSEDPVVTGYMASAVVTGLQSTGVSACPKHFACNNIETNRTHNDSVVSKRALRELYLKGFEICVKRAKPHNLMTSYNQVNGVWSHYHYELVNLILREEWGYQGNVITDWWMRDAVSPEFINLRKQAYRVRSGVDVLMPGGERTGKKQPDGTLLETLGKPNGITRAELQQAALHVLSFAVTKIKRESQKTETETDH